MKTNFVYSAVALVVAVAFTVTSLMAQDPVKAAPQAFKERLNNENVRVLEYTSKPGDKEAMHSHPDITIYFVKGGKYRSTAADGKATDVEVKDGDVVWRKGVTHSVENIGKTEIRAILIESKPAAKK